MTFFMQEDTNSSKFKTQKETLGINKVLKIVTLELARAKLINNLFLNLPIIIHSATDGVLQTRPPVSVQLGKTNFTIPEVFRYKMKNRMIAYSSIKQALDIQRLIKSEYSWFFFRVPDCIGYCLAGN